MIIFDYKLEDLTSSNFLNTILESITKTIDNSVRVKLQSPSFKQNFYNENCNYFLFENKFPIVNPNTKSLDSGLLHYALLTCSINKIDDLSNIVEYIILSNNFKDDYAVHLEGVENLIPVYKLLKVLKGFI